jgi:methionine synthase I (cobalamin-dependent)
MSGLATEEVTERSVALRGALAERVVISDGAMGTMLQASDATLDDFEPEQSTDAIVLHHPDARYFSV